MKGLCVVILCWAAPVWAGVGMNEAQGAADNASGVMDGSLARPALQADAVEAPQAPAAQARTPQAAPTVGARLDKSAVPSPAAGAAPKAPAKNGKLRGLYKWMVRNPVEASAAVGIPVTLVAGPMIGMLAGTAVYMFLLSRQRKPF